MGLTGRRSFFVPNHETCRLHREQGEQADHEPAVALVCFHDAGNVDVYGLGPVGDPSFKSAVGQITLILRIHAPTACQGTVRASPLLACTQMCSSHASFFCLVPPWHQLLAILFLRAPAPRLSIGLDVVLAFQGLTWCLAQPVACVAVPSLQFAPPARVEVLNNSCAGSRQVSVLLHLRRCLLLLLLSFVFSFFNFFSFVFCFSSFCCCCDPLLLLLLLLLPLILPLLPLIPHPPATSLSRPSLWQLLI